MTDTKKNSILLFAFAFCVTSSYMLNRIIGDSLLLARIGAKALPLMLVIGAIVVGGISFVWARQSRHVPISRLVYVTQFGSTGLTLAHIWMLLYLPTSTTVIGGIYVLAELRGCFNLILIATLLNEHFCSKTEHGRFAFVNAGSPVAGILVGLLLGMGAGGIRPAFLLGGCCLLDVAAVLIASFVKSKRTQIATAEWQTHVEPAIVDISSLQSAGIDKHLRRFTNALMLVIISKTIVLSIVAFEWKVMADRALGNDEEALERYFGLFYAISDALILFIQLALTRGILARVGIRFSLLILPFALWGTGVFSLLTKDIWLLFGALTVARGSVVLRRSIHDVAIQIIYGAMPTRVRRGIVARVLGIAKPMSEAAAAALVGLFASTISVRTFAWFWMPFLVLWLVYTIKLGVAWKQVAANKQAAQRTNF